jgi:hypothetical protein
MALGDSGVGRTEKDRRRRFAGRDDLRDERKQNKERGESAKACAGRMAPDTTSDNISA